MTERRTDTVSVVIKAAPSTIYRALLDPDALAAWLPPEGMRGQVVEFDATEGGGYRMVLTYVDGETRGKSSGASDVVETRFRRLVADELVVQEVDFESDDPAFAGTMTMSWKLSAVADGTEVTVTAEDVPAGIRPKDHEVGMRSSLANLAAFAE